MGRTLANVTGLEPLFDVPGRLAASTTERVLLEGDPAELIGPNTDVQPVPVLRRMGRSRKSCDQPNQLLRQAGPLQVPRPPPQDRWNP